MTARSNKLAEAWKIKEWNEAGETATNREKLAIALQNKLVDMADWFGMTKVEIVSSGHSGKSKDNPGGNITTQSEQSFFLTWNGEDFVIEVIQDLFGDGQFLGRTVVPVESVEDITGKLLGELVFDLSYDNDFRITREPAKIRRLRNQRINEEFGC